LDFCFHEEMNHSHSLKILCGALILSVASATLAQTNQSPIFRNQNDSGRGDSTTIGGAPSAPTQVLTVYETDHQVCSGVNVVNKYSNGTEMVTKANAPECGYTPPSEWHGWLNHWFGW
jgi:hypothetical protein